jgi:hypothetical protein
VEIPIRRTQAVRPDTTFLAPTTQPHFASGHDEFLRHSKTRRFFPCRGNLQRKTRKHTNKQVSARHANRYTANSNHTPHDGSAVAPAPVVKPSPQLQPPPQPNFTAVQTPTRPPARNSTFTGKNPCSGLRHHHQSYLQATHRGVCHPGQPDLEGAERILAQMDCLDRYSDRGSPPFGPHPCEEPVC